MLLKDEGMDNLWMLYPYFIHILSILYPSSIHSLSISTLYPWIIHQKFTTSTIYPCIISKTSIVYPLDKVWINHGDYQSNICLIFVQIFLVIYPLFIQVQALSIFHPGILVTQDDTHPSFIQY